MIRFSLISVRRNYSFAEVIRNIVDEPFTQLFSLDFIHIVSVAEDCDFLRCHDFCLNGAALLPPLMKLT